MSEWIAIARVGELDEGAMKGIAVDGRRVLLALVGGEYLAAADRCPHMGAALSEGQLQGTVVTCPRHGSQFDLKDGRVVRWLKAPGVIAAVGRALMPPRPLDTYRVKVEGQDVLISIEG
ncbi:MAG: non-heme iron oxygenase ferredoxin subunit [Chloroflexota bacterium]|nr:non-heme iron oxygenase ferredoxin subunit [Chloroflexota bacterium]